MRFEPRGCPLSCKQLCLICGGSLSDQHRLRFVLTQAIGKSGLSNGQLRGLNPSNEFVELNTEFVRLTS